MKRLVVLLLVAGLVGCSSGDGGEVADPTTETTAGAGGDPGDCTVVDAAISPEKIDLVTDLAETFNASPEARDGGMCWFIAPHRKSSGAAARALYLGWDEAAEGPLPVLWSPAASTWGQVVNRRLTEGGETPFVPDDFERFMLTPLVIAMPEPMATALGYPANPVGWDQILELARAQAGWADFGHPEFGPFRLGKTNPNFSTSGLAALIAQTYAATGKTTDLTAEDLADAGVIQYATDVESAVVHYGDTTLTFLNNLYRADQRGNALNYVSAVAVEEKSVLDYNAGNPDGILEPGEEPRPPRVPLVAIYPEEGTLFSDNPLFVLTADWVDEDEAEGARRFVEFVGRPENQERVLEFGFRPANPDVAVGAPIVAANGVDPSQPTTLLDVPGPEVMLELLDRWETQRKRARVMLVIDVSGSMGDPADAANPSGPTRLDLAKQAAVEAIELFAEDDEIALRMFSNDIDGDGLVGDADPEGDVQFEELVGYGRVGDNAELVRSRIRDLRPLYGTPLYGVTQSSYDAALESFDPTRINAVVLLTDGVNDDGDTSDDRQQLDELLANLESGAEGQLSRPVRVFTIAYSADAAADSLSRIAASSSAASYESTDPASILQVLTAVISNF
ncbi:MAG: substrate-binding and VWA domain-containing protein [Actinomycetota bacterium]|nr:substrate-binding domain-containing protein [Acidimicrobiia bacterium]MDQ3293638.1 substrate-binding and VWA domain-containing protein [Actinomycetota bacterium]